MSKNNLVHLFGEELASKIEENTKYNEELAKNTNTYKERVDTALCEIKKCERNYKMTAGQDYWYARQCLNRVQEILEGTRK